MFCDKHTDSQVVRLQPKGVLRKQSVPPLLPAYNKFMGGVYRTAHIRKTYEEIQKLLAEDCVSMFGLCY